MENKENKDKFTLRNAAKKAAKTIVRVKTSRKVKELITDYTQFDEDNLVVEIAAGSIGWWFGDKLEPYTNKLVDMTADFIVAKREEMKQSDSQTQKETADK